MSTALAKAPAVAAVRYRLAQLGWEIDAIDVDLVRSRARICLRRGVVRVTFDASDGRATTTREAWRTSEQRTGRRGDRARCARIFVDFLGRQRHTDLRDGLRWLSEYLTSNGAAPALPHRADEVFMPLLAAEGAVR